MDAIDEVSRGWNRFESYGSKYHEDRKNIMPVYVDRLRDWGWRRGPSCHLVGDTEEELHAFALRLELKAEWLQLSPIAHFDLTADRRVLAVRMGAIEISNRQLALLLRARRLIPNA